MQEPICTACNRSGAEVNYLLSPPGMKPICADCLNEYGGFYKYLIDMGVIDVEGFGFDVEEELDDFEEIDVEMHTENILDLDFVPKDITKALDKHVIGQDKAKKVLSVAAYNHYKRLKDTTGKIRKSNILMIGPTGSGKTLLAQELSKVLGVPFAIADATSLTEAGYVGDDVENVLVRLLNAADGNVALAEKGIVFIDEIDKIARKGENTSITRDVSGEGVQHALLKIIEGAEVSVPVNGGRKHPQGDNITINTKDILFICGGAFEGINKKSNKKNPLGFCSVESLTEDADLSDDRDEMIADKLVHYGITPELIGRLPIVVELNELTYNDLKRILIEPENALTKEYQALIEADGIGLEFDEEALDEIVKVAMKRKSGARGLRSIMEDIMLDIMYDLPSDDLGINKCIVTKETVYDHKPDILFVA